MSGGVGDFPARSGPGDRLGDALAGQLGHGLCSVPPAIGRWLERCVKIKAKQVQLPPAPKDWRRRYPLELIGRDALERLGDKRLGEK